MGLRPGIDKLINVKKGDFTKFLVTILWNPH